MAQSLARLWTHLIFSTKDRFPFLSDKPMRADMHKVICEEPRHGGGREKFARRANLPDELLPKFEGICRPHRELVSERGTEIGNVSASDFVPDWQNPTLAINFPSDEPLQLPLRPRFTHKRST